MKIRDIITNEDQSKPIQRPRFRDHLKKNYDIEFTKLGADINLIHGHKMPDHNPENQLPIVILERMDSANLRNRRDLLNDNRVKGIIKNTCLPFSLINEETYQGRYHCSLIKKEFPVIFKDEPLDKKPQPITEEQYSKIFIGWNFGMYDLVISCLIYKPSFDSLRPIDVHFAGNIKYGRCNSIEEHRRACVNKIKTLSPPLRIIAETNRYQKRLDYQKTLHQTKIVVSPWGFGEACYRDYEAMYCGCVLIKPNSDFVKVEPNIYQSNITYVPCSPNFEDLKDKVNYVLSNWKSFRSMRENNYSILTKALEVDSQCKRFSDIMRSIKI